MEMVQFGGGGLMWSTNTQLCQQLGGRGEAAGPSGTTRSASTKLAGSWRLVPPSPLSPHVQQLTAHSSRFYRCCDIISAEGQSVHVTFSSAEDHSVHVTFSCCCPGEGEARPQSALRQRCSK